MQPMLSTNSYLIDTDQDIRPFVKYQLASGGCLDVMARALIPRGYLPYWKTSMSTAPGDS